MFSTCNGYFSIILSTVHRKSFRLTELHKLSLEDANLHVRFNVRFSIYSGVASKLTLRSFHDLEVICSHLKLLHAKLYRPGVMVPELHDMRIICLLKAVTPAWVTNTVSFTL